MFLAPQEGDAYNTANGRVTAGPLLERARRDYASKLFSSSLIYAYMQFKFLCTGQPGVGQLNHFRSAEMYLIEACTSSRPKPSAAWAARTPTCRP